MRTTSKQGGPLNPIDDMPARIMPHVMSVISSSDDPAPNKTWNLGNLVGTKDLTSTKYIRPFRHIAKEFQGKDMRPDAAADMEDIKLRLLKNMKTLELIHDLKSQRVAKLSKLAKLDEYDRTHGSIKRADPYKKNIHAGGLMSDWEFVMDMDDNAQIM